MTTLEGMLSIAWELGLLLGPGLLLMRGPAVHKPGSVTTTPSRQRDNSSSSIVNDATTGYVIDGSTTAAGRDLRHSC